MGKREVNTTSLLYFNEVYVSESDLSSSICMQVIESALNEGILKEGYTVEDVLYFIWGININLSYDADTCKHKTRLGTVCNGVRYVGYERSDKDWLNNPLCSDEMRKGYESLIAKENWDKW